MLSKPSLESSPGSSAAASIGRSSRSRTALAYSVRFSRCSTGAPGFGAAAAARSIVASTAAANPSSVARSGRGALAGGIMPVRTFRTTFSHVCALAPGLRDVEPIERQAAGPHPRVVTGDAVAIDNRLRSRAPLACPEPRPRVARVGGTRRSVWVSTLASANTNSAAAASMRAFMAWPTQPSAFRAARSSPACAPRRPRPERRPRPSGAASVLPCP